MLFQTFAILAIAPVYTFGLPAPQIDLVRRDEDSSDLLKQLLPGGKGLKIWSTAVGIVDGAVPLTLNALKPSVNDKKAPPLFNDKEAPSNNTLGVEFKKGGNINIALGSIYMPLIYTSFHSQAHGHTRDLNPAVLMYTQNLLTSLKLGR